MRRQVRAVSSLFVVLAIIAAGCGVPRDTTPQVLVSDEIPQGLRPGQLPTPLPEVPIASGEISNRQVFMIGAGNRLQGVERMVEDDPLELLEVLLLGTSLEERAEGIYTTLTRDTRVQSVEINDLFLIATVDLAPGSLDAQRTEQKLSFAQIVFTLTSLPGIEEVQFIQSDPSDPTATPASIPVQTDTGTTLPGQRVSREQFALLDPELGPPVPAFDDIPTVTPTPVTERDPDLPPLFDLPIWKLNELDQLVKVSRQVERSPEALLRSLFDGTSPDEREETIRSALPPDALPESIEISTSEVTTTDAEGEEITALVNTALVDLTVGSLPPPDDPRERILATAQIVFTMTELIEIDHVALAVDGIPIPMDIPAGITLPFGPDNPIGISRSDFVGLLPPADRPAPVEDPGDATSDVEPVVVPEPTPTPAS